MLTYPPVVLPPSRELLDYLRERYETAESEKALTSLPTVIFDEEMYKHCNPQDQQDGEVGLCCAICLGDYVPGDKCRILPCPGNHYFHRE